MESIYRGIFKRLIFGLVIGQIIGSIFGQEGLILGWTLGLAFGQQGFVLIRKGLATSQEPVRKLDKYDNKIAERLFPSFHKFAADSENADIVKAFESEVTFLSSKMKRNGWVTFSVPNDSLLGLTIRNYEPNVNEFFHKSPEEFESMKNESGKKPTVINKSVTMRQSHEVFDKLAGKDRDYIDNVLGYMRARLMMEVFRNESLRAKKHFLRNLGKNPFFLHTTNMYNVDFANDVKGRNSDPREGAKPHTDFGYITTAITNNRGLYIVTKSGERIDTWSEGSINVTFMFGRVMEMIYNPDPVFMSHQDQPKTRTSVFRRALKTVSVMGQKATQMVFGSGLSFMPRAALHEVRLPENITKRIFIGIFCDPGMLQALYKFDGTKICDKYGLQLFNPWFNGWTSTSK